VSGVRKISEGVREIKLRRDSPFVILGRRTQEKVPIEWMFGAEGISKAKNQRPGFAGEAHEISTIVRSW
jgi:hypothetical protein